MEALKIKLEELRQQLGNEQAALQRAESRIVKTREDIAAVIRSLRLLGEDVPDMDEMPVIQAKPRGRRQTGDSLHGRVASVIKHEPDVFDAAVITRSLKDVYPDAAAVTEDAVRKALARMGRDEDIEIVTPGSRRQAATYRRKQGGDQPATTPE